MCVLLGDAMKATSGLKATCDQTNVFRGLPRRQQLGAGQLDLLQSQTLHPHGQSGQRLRGPERHRRFFPGLFHAETPPGPRPGNSAGAGAGRPRRSAGKLTLVPPTTCLATCFAKVFYIVGVWPKRDVPRHMFSWRDFLFPLRQVYHKDATLPAWPSSSGSEIRVLNDGRVIKNQEEDVPVGFGHYQLKARVYCQWQEKGGCVQIWLISG